MNKFIEILLGLILVIVPILIVLYVPAFFSWATAAIEFLKGGVVVSLILIGILFVILGISDLKS